MDETQTLGVQQARENLRDRIDAALERGEHTVITRVGRPVAVLVPHHWYIQVPPHVPVSWTEHDDEDGDSHETGWITAIEGEQAVINCDCGPRIVRRPLNALTVGLGT